MLLLIIIMNAVKITSTSLVRNTALNTVLFSIHFEALSVFSSLGKVQNLCKGRRNSGSEGKDTCEPIEFSIPKSKLCSQAASRSCYSTSG